MRAWERSSSIILIVAIRSLHKLRVAADVMILASWLFENDVSTRGICYSRSGSWRANIVGPRGIYFSRPGSLRIPSALEEYICRVPAVCECRFSSRKERGKKEGGVLLKADLDRSERMYVWRSRACTMSRACRGRTDASVHGKTRTPRVCPSHLRAA